MTPQRAQRSESMPIPPAPSLDRRRNGTVRPLVLLFVMLCVAGVSGPRWWAAPPTLDDVAERCFARVEFPAVDADIKGVIADARVYFRAEQFEDFFYVKMVEREGQWVGTLPVPSAETERVTYYVQAVDRSLDDARSSDYSVPVVEEGDCDEQRVLGLVPEVYDAAGNLVPGLPGFEAVAVAGTGGLGAGEIIGLAAGGALAGTAVIEAIDGDQEPEAPASPSGR